MKDRRLASRYARALLAALASSAAADSADEFLAALADALRRSPELRDVLVNPAVPRSAKKAVLAALVEGRALPREVRGFLFVVVDHGRADVLPAIADAFREEKQRAEGIVPAAVTSAAPLAPETVERARVALEKLTGRKVRLTCAVEPSLLGGAVTRIGSVVYDGSLRTQLAALRRRMAEE